MKYKIMKKVKMAMDRYDLFDKICGNFFYLRLSVCSKDPRIKKIESIHIYHLIHTYAIIKFSSYFKLILNPKCNIKHPSRINTFCFMDDSLKKFENAPALFYPL